MAALSIITIPSGLVYLCTPPMITSMIESHGWRDANLVLAAICVQVLRHRLKISCNDFCTLDMFHTFAIPLSGCNSFPPLSPFLLLILALPSPLYFSLPLSPPLSPSPFPHSLPLSHPSLSPSIPLRAPFISLLPHSPSSLSLIPSLCPSPLPSLISSLFPFSVKHSCITFSQTIFLSSAGLCICYAPPATQTQQQIHLQ